nr:hypothetical protein [Tanacetum cinerariifolium]
MILNVFCNVLNAANNCFIWFWTLHDVIWLMLVLCGIFGSEGYTYPVLYGMFGSERYAYPVLCSIIGLAGYAYPLFSIVVSMCCDDAYHVTPHVFALARCDRLVSELLVIGILFSCFSLRLFRPTGYSISKDPEEKPIEEEPLEEPEEKG